MAYDPVRNEIVLFGCEDNAGQRKSATWYLPDGHWSRRMPATSPKGTKYGVMAWESVLERLILFGSYNPDASDKTWHLDGTDVDQAAPAEGAIGVVGHLMAYDQTLDSLVLFGGAS